MSRVALLVVATLLAGGCRGNGESGARAAGPRVVSLHDVTTEVVVALGALTPGAGGARLVGVGEPVNLAPAAIAAIKDVPRVGGLESILAVKPNVVLGMGIVQEKDPELVSALRGAGIDVYLPAPATLDDTYVLVREVAARAAMREAGTALVERTRAAAGGDQAATRPVRVFVYDCCDPPFTAGGQTVFSDLIRRAGGTNIFAEQKADWTHVSWEEVIARKPELVVIDSYKYDGQGDTTEKEKALRAIPTLAKVPVAVMPLGCALGGLRSVEGLDRLRTAIRGVRP